MHEFHEHHHINITMCIIHMNHCWQVLGFKQVQVLGQVLKVLRLEIPSFVGIAIRT